jgi:hypothetical protein
MQLVQTQWQKEAPRPRSSRVKATLRLRDPSPCDGAGRDELALTGSPQRRDTWGRRGRALCNARIFILFKLHYQSFA